MFWFPFVANANNDFFNQRYRGWFWYEKNEKMSDQEPKISAQEAHEEIEILKREMDEKRNIMIVRPTAENVINYIMLEKRMWDRALKLDEAFREAKIRYPEYFNKLNDPTNVHAVKLKRKYEKEIMKKKIKRFAQKYNLVLFTNAYCQYSQTFAPVLKKFSDEYKIDVQEVSTYGKASGLFRAVEIPVLANHLDIKNTPLIVALRKDGKRVFEFARGYLSISELEDYCELAEKYEDKILGKSGG